MAVLPESDAFGAMCRDYHEHGEAFEVVERDDGFLNLPGGPEVYFTTPDEWGDLDHTAVEWAEGHVLDVGCGPGRHALALQERGHDVTGIDRSPGALSVARDRGVTDARRCDVADAASLDEQVHLDYHERNRENGRLPGRVRIRTRYRRYVGEWHDYLHVAPDTMRELVDDTPWTVVDVEQQGPHYVAKLRSA